jgi:hypothetical protein
VNYARRQQYRRLLHAISAACAGASALLVALVLVSAQLTSLAALAVLGAVGFGTRARRWLALAGRSRVGAGSEDEVRRQLSTLERDGWRLRHSLAWRGRGDIDSVAIAPSGIAFAIETKTRSYEARHLARVHEQAVWLSRRRRRWCCNGALPVLCIVRARGVQHLEQDVLVVSIDRLTLALRPAAGMLHPGGDRH